MNKLSKISDDVLDKKIDYSGLAKAENENPLKKGQTLDFQGMLQMQMQRGRYHASRIMKPAAGGIMQDGDVMQAEAAVKADNGIQTEAAMVQNNNKAQTEAMTAQGAEGVQTAAMNTGSDITNFRMQQAISAYEMFMTA